ARSRPSALSTATICAPPSTVDIGEGESMSPAWANTTLGCAARSRNTSVASRASPPRRPSSTGSSTYVSLICSSVISTVRDGAGACVARAAQPAGTPAARPPAARRTRRLTLRDASQPGMIAAAREPLRQVAARTLRVAGAKARLEQRVVEDVALRAAAAQLYD